MFDIQNPIFTLYAFHFWSDFDQGYQMPAKNAEALWETFATTVATTFNSEDLKNFRANLHPVQENEPWQDLIKGQRKLKLSQIPLTQTLQAKGAFHAEKLQDVYLAELTLFLDKRNCKIPLFCHQINGFNPNNILSYSTLNPSLGQSFLLYAEPSKPIALKDYRALADDCVTGLFPDRPTEMIPRPLQTRQGQLFGSPLFLYEAENTYILVWLKFKENSLSSFSNSFNQSLKQLLCFRHKIFFTTQQSKQYYQEAQKLANELEQQIPRFSQIEKETDDEKRLQELKRLLKDIRKRGFDYSKTLRLLRECYNTTDTNIKNFQKAFTEINQAKWTDDHFPFWDAFLDLAKNTYLQQIETDLNYLLAGQNLFQEMIATIRGMLEIEQIEADRSLQNQIQKSSKQEAISNYNLNITIWAVGTGMATAGVIATSYALITPENPVLMPWDAHATTVHPFVELVFWSLAVGLVLGIFLVTSFLQWIPQNENDRQKAKTPDDR
ncbi:MAG: hypothetical protein J7545_02535 [Roseofilum sp. SBFL]|uniref:hypothetical protein n=1 Tax=unclassified Roseofilum TaxID=2620099 RepID=UPI001B1FEE41|nr:MULTISPECIES: hypothetical protein [unclassified Roseofilum]MBP0013248.1 hypothetical protein [Roseofilum sp. SID3]MBP0026406.1 hypothetical protein [Roseofilum sp. SID2]MBP0038237.1 hypothetical protein [Roseofilum sp. SID1]MBP0040842.1 hypothetical protein [Roseofilum sp. SBFL]